MTVRSPLVIYVTAACYVTRNGDRLKVVLVEADSDAIEIHYG